MIEVFRKIKPVYILIIIVVLAAVLRLWNLTNYPAGFNADEAALGYNAYSLLQTGRDEYGTPFPLDFKSFGDYKPGLYVYLDMPFVAALGLNVLAVRLPSALFGIATVLLVYFLAKKIFKSRGVGLLSAFLLSISPWQIHFSRGAWETNVATFFITLGIWFFLIGLKNTKFYFLSLLSFLFAMYTYQSPRLVVPVFVLFLAGFYFKKIWAQRKKLIPIIVVLIIISVPLILEFTSGGGTARFNGLSIFSDPGPASRTNQLIGEEPNKLVGKVLHNKVTAYGESFWGHYLDHFTPDFLFINGDPLIRDTAPAVGEFYIVEALFLIVGLIVFATGKYKNSKVLIIWILVGPLASALTYQTPNALRSENMVVPLTIIMGLGLYKILRYFDNYLNSRIIYKKAATLISILLIIGMLTFEFGHYLESYFVYYPVQDPLSWEYGFSQMVTKLESYQSNYKQVMITDRYDQPYILVLFFEKYDPKKYQPQAYLSERDKFDFGTVRSFDKYQFHTITSQEIKNSKNILFITNPINNLPSNAKIIDKVDFPNGQPAFLFIQT